MNEEDSQSNYEVFRECLSGPIIQKSAVKPTKPRKRKAGRSAIKPVEIPDLHEEHGGNDAEDLADFVDVRGRTTSPLPQRRR